MEQFTLLRGDQTLKSSREPLNNALLTVRSLSSGDAFPTTNLSVGMLCYRTDQAKLYQLADADAQTWTDKIAANIAGNAVSASSVAWEDVTAKPAVYPPDTHTHDYAGASSAGGAATSAVKLATARTINDVPFDGTADITLTMPWANITDKPASYTAADKLATARTINGVAFDGTSNITITPSYSASIGNASAANPAVVVSSYRSDSSWYRKYSDGWTEQGGRLTASLGEGTNTTTTLITPFATNTYTLALTTDYIAATSKDNAGATIVSKSTTNFVYANTDYNSKGVAGDWYACGY